MSPETIIGISASVLTTTSMLPQLFKLLKEKKSEDVSLWMLLILFAGICLWIIYGIMKNDFIIIISNAISLFINVIIVVLKIKFKKTV